MANHNNNNNSGLEYISIYIPLDDETRAERKEIVADAALELQGYDLQIKAFKATLEDKIKAAKAKHTQALLELKTNQFALEGDYISYVNETNRRSTMTHALMRMAHSYSLPHGHCPPAKSANSK